MRSRVRHIVSGLLMIVGIVTIIPAFTGSATAHHAEAKADVQCDGTISWTAKAWQGYPDNPDTPENEYELSRTNATVRVWIEILAGGGTPPADQFGSFNPGNNFTFSGTFTWPAGATIVNLKVEALATWGNGMAAGSGPWPVYLEFPNDCEGTTTTGATTTTTVCDGGSTTTTQGCGTTTTVGQTTTTTIGCDGGSTTTTQGCGTTTTVGQTTTTTIGCDGGSTTTTQGCGTTTTVGQTTTTVGDTTTTTGQTTTTTGQTTTTVGDTTTTTGQTTTTTGQTTTTVGDTTTTIGGTTTTVGGSTTTTVGGSTTTTVGGSTTTTVGGSTTTTTIGGQTTTTVSGTSPQGGTLPRSGGGTDSKQTLSMAVGLGCIGSALVLSRPRLPRRWRMMAG